MVMVPPVQIVFSATAWISMMVYFYMICKVLQSRRNISQFNSSYYSLLLLQSAADFYVFIFVEFVMRPRKFDYFDLFSENMQSYALFSMTNVMFSKGVLCSGHIIMALNRLTAFYLPLKQEKIWSKWMVILSVVSLWILSILASLPALIIYRNVPRFFLTSSGVLQMSSAILDEYDSYEGVAVSSVTVVVCSVCYLLSYKEAKRRKYAMVDQRLFLCAVASAFPFCIDMIRSILLLISLKLKHDLYKTVATVWFYEMEATVASSVWLQLIINKSVRDLILKERWWRKNYSVGLKRVSTHSMTARVKF